METSRVFRLRVGALSGLAIVVVTTVLNLMGRHLGWFPPAMDLTHMAEFLVDPELQPVAASILGILVHVVSGVVIGMAYVYLVHSPGPVSGILFMLPLWLLMMLVAMPLLGEGWFGLKSGGAAAIGTFTLNVIFGAGMGIIVRWLSKRRGHGGVS